MLTRSLILLFVLLVLVQSTCKWQQIRPLMEIGKMKTCGRTPQNEKIYEAHIAKLKNAGITLPQHIKDVKFGFNGKAQKPIYMLNMLDEGAHQKPLPIYLLAYSLNDHPWLVDKVGGFGLGRLREDENFVILTPNDFPYNFEKGIEHWILWGTEHMDLSKVDKILKSVVHPDFETISYVNEPKDKSIPEIFHAQMFVRSRPVEQL